MTTPFSVASTRFAQAHDRDTVVELFAAAYADSPIAQWIQPDPTIRATAIAHYAEALFERAVARGVVLLSADSQAAAIWYLNDLSDRHDTPMVQPGDSAEADELNFIAVLGAGAAARLELLTDVLAHLRPTTAHHELAHLCVHPEHQRQGLAGSLLTDHHAHLDAAAIPAYAVAPSRDVRDFYARHGYTVQQRATVPGGPTLWTMLRPPHVADDFEPSTASESA